MRELLKAGLLHEDVNTVAGFGLSRYTLEPWLNNGELDWREGAEKSLDSNVIASFEQPFSHHGGTKVLSGNLGRAVMKTSAVPVENQVIEAPAVVFESQHDVNIFWENSGLVEQNARRVLNESFINALPKVAPVEQKTSLPYGNDFIKQVAEMASEYNRKY